jgi:hypothetical protein
MNQIIAFLISGSCCGARAEWLDDRVALLLNVPFTVNA